MPKGFFDDSAEPLLLDSEECGIVYLSPRYSSGVIEVLEGLGLKTLSTDEILKLIEIDLESDQSRIRSQDTSSAWQTAFYKYLLPLVDDNVNDDWEAYRKLRSLPIIPLTDFRLRPWTSLDEGSVYWNTKGDAAIPLDLGLRLIAPEMSNIASRRAFAKEMGVEECPHVEIKKKIVRRYSKWGAVSRTQSVAHIEYLFRRDRSASEQLDKLMPLFNQDESPVYRTNVTLGHNKIIRPLYLESKDTYSASKVLDRLKDFSETIKPSKHLLHNAYSKSLTEHDKEYWQTWLIDAASIYSYPRLSTAKGEPSDLLEDMIMHLPGETLYVLKEHWTKYQPVVESEVSVRQALRNMEVDSKFLAYNLDEYYLPEARLLKYVADVGLEGNFPFLNIDQSPDVGGWDFLTKWFDVGITRGLAFYTRVLERFVIVSAEEPLEVSGLLQIYSDIVRHATHDDFDEVR